MGGLSLSANLMNLPDLPGLTWRALTRADLPAVLSLQAACLELGSAAHSPVIDFERIEYAPNTLAAFDAASRCVAYAVVFVIDALKHELRAFLEGLVHPDWRGRGIGAALLGWMQSRGCALLDVQPNGRDRVLRVDFYERGPDAVALLEAQGFTYNFAEDEMVFSLDWTILPGTLPADVQIVPWSDDRARDFYTVYDNAFRTRPGFPAWSQEVWVHNYTANAEFRPDLSLLALAGETPVAYALSAVDELDGAHVGWVVQMGTRVDQRGRGLGGGLLAEVLRRFRAEGLARAYLEVNANNPAARAVYERIGFRLVRRYTSYVKRVDGMRCP